MTRSVKRVGSDVHAGADRGEWQVKDAPTFLGSVRGDRLYAAFLLSVLGLRRGEVCGLRWEHVDLTGDQAEARKLAKGMPSVAVENNRVSTLDRDTHTLVIEHQPQGKGRTLAPYLPAPQPLVDALRPLKTQQAKERLAAGEAYRSCPTCDGTHLADELGVPYRPEWNSDRFLARDRAIGLPGCRCTAAGTSRRRYWQTSGCPRSRSWPGSVTPGRPVTRGYQHVMVERPAEASRKLGDAF